MSRTRVDLVHRALKKLGKLEVGEAPLAEDLKAVDDEIDSLLERLTRKMVCYIPDADDIDEAMFQPLAYRLAWECATDFAIPLETIPDCAPAVTEGELRVLSADPNTDDVVPFEDF